MRNIGIIPARYASTRLPAKPLAIIGNKSMIQLVYEQALKSKMLTKVVIATDHPLIYDTVKSFGAEVFMTSTDCPNGTMRCYEVLTQLNQSYDHIINIQGDEPFISPILLDDLLEAMEQDSSCEILTAVTKINALSTLFNPNVVKAVVGPQKFDLKLHKVFYFSRSPIPFIRDSSENEWLNQHTYFKHLGIYAFRTHILKEIVHLSESNLEKAEKLEQLRWLEADYTIKAIIHGEDSFGIDTPDDLLKANELIQKKKF